jgi:hypothetical protein
VISDAVTACLKVVGRTGLRLEAKRAVGFRSIAGRDTTHNLGGGKHIFEGVLFILLHFVALMSD